MNIEAPDYYRVIKELPTPESEVMIRTFHEAIELLREGKYVAEIALNRDAANPYYLKKVYKFDGEFFQVNVHLGTFVKTSTFDMYTNLDTNRKFIEVAVIKNEEFDMPIKGSSSKPDREFEEFEQHLQGTEALLKDLEGIEISTPPMFFEDDLGSLININFIEGFQSLKSGRNLLMIGGKELALNEDETRRFREFAKLHGIFGKDQ